MTKVYTPKLQQLISLGGGSIDDFIFFFVF